MAYTTTVADILKSIASNVNGEASAPTAGSDDETLWMNLVQSSQSDWDSTHDWEVLRKTYDTTMAQSGTSVALPADFKKLDGYPVINGSEYEEIRPEDTPLYENSDYVLVGGNPADGYYLTVYSALTSNASVSIRYFARPTTLATTTQIPVLTNPDYLVAQTSMKILRQRGDPKFTLFQQEADLLLARMVEEEIRTYDQKDTSIPHWAEKTKYFVPGED